MLGFWMPWWVYCLWLWAVLSLNYFILGGKRWGSFQLKTSPVLFPSAVRAALPGTSGLLSPWLRKALVTYRNSCWDYSSSEGNHEHISVLIKCPGASTHRGDTLVTVCVLVFVGHNSVRVRRLSEGAFQGPWGLKCGQYQNSSASVAHWSETIMLFFTILG